MSPEHSNQAVTSMKTQVLEIPTKQKKRSISCSLNGLNEKNIISSVDTIPQPFKKAKNISEIKSSNKSSFDGENQDPDIKDLKDCTPKVVKNDLCSTSSNITEDLDNRQSISYKSFDILPDYKCLSCKLSDGFNENIARQEYRYCEQKLKHLENKARQCDGCNNTQTLTSIAPFKNQNNNFEKSSFSPPSYSPVNKLNNNQPEYLKRWQNQHIAKALVDNAINKSLEDLGVSPNRSDNQLQSQRRQLEQQGVEHVIGLHGLRSQSFDERQLILSRLTQVSENIFARNMFALPSSSSLGDINNYKNVDNTDGSTGGCSVCSQSQNSGLDSKPYSCTGHCSNSSSDHYDSKSDRKKVVLNDTSGHYSHSNTDSISSDSLTPCESSDSQKISENDPNFENSNIVDLYSVSCDDVIDQAMDVIIRNKGLGFKEPI